MVSPLQNLGFDANNIPVIVVSKLLPSPMSLEENLQCLKLLIGCDMETSSMNHPDKVAKQQTERNGAYLR